MTYVLIANPTPTPHRRPTMTRSRKSGQDMTMKTCALDERMSEAADLVAAAEEITDSLRNAESCETASDFDANVDDAICNAESLLKALKDLRA